MKISEVIENCKKLKESAFDESVVVGWFSRLDGRVSEELIKPETPMTAYSYPADLQTQLLIPYPYDEAYIHYVESMVDYSNEEYDKYQNSYAMFNSAFGDYRKQYHRTHTPAETYFSNTI